jgi:hypothetical protein
VSSHAEWPGPSWSAGPPDEPGPDRAPPAAFAALAAAVTALGIPLGVLWALIAPDVPVRVTEAGLAYIDSQPEQVAAADGWFVLLAVPFGLLAAGGAWLLIQRTRGVGGLVAVTVGAIGAGLLAWWLGRQLGLSGYEAAVQSAPEGSVLHRPGDLRIADAGWWPPLVTGVPLVPGLVAAVTYTLLAAWSRFPDLRPDDSQRVDMPDG